MARYRTMQDAVGEFQKAFNRPMNKNFSDWTFDVAVADMLHLREALIEEEFIELAMALRSGNELHAKKEAADLLFEKIYSKEY